MNIGLVTHEYPPDTAWGGIATHMSLLAQGLASRGHTVHVVTKALERDETIQDGSVTVHRVTRRNVYPKKDHLTEFYSRLEYSVGVREKVLQLVGEEGLDLVQAHPMGGPLFLFSLEPSCPIVSYLSTSYRQVAECQSWEMNSDILLSSWMEDEIIMRSLGVMSPTHAQAKSTAQYLPIDIRNVSIVPCAFTIPKKKKKLPGLNKKNTKKPLHILFIGRLEQRKGVHTLIRAIPRVVEQFPNVRFTFIGGDTYEGASGLANEGSALTSFKRKLLLDLPHQYYPKVQFLGYCENAVLRKHLSNCDVFVAPSLHESFGIVYLEAMAYGKPVVGCKTGGVPEVVEEGKTGILVPVDNSADLAEALLKLLRDRKLRKQLGDQGRKHVEARFSVDNMVDRTLKVYEAVCRKADRPGQS